MSYIIRNKYRLLLVTMLIIVFASCRRQLLQIPQSDLSDASFWKTAADLRTGCNYLYSYLPGFDQVYDDLYTDIAFGKSPNSVSNGSMEVPNTSGNWNADYQLIRNTNNILEKSNSVTGATEDITRYKGEALFFRAYAYFDLLKRFGNAPLITATINDATDTALYTRRTPRQVIVEYIFKDLDSAATYLPQPDDTKMASDYGRITRGVALGFKSRVALFEGTWDKFRGIGTANSNLKAAVDAAQAIITEGKYSLYYASGADIANSYGYDFQYDGGSAGNPNTYAIGPEKNFTYATNKENMLVRLYGVSISNNISSHSFIRSGLEQGGVVGTKNLVDLYLYKDGLAKGKSAFDSSIQQTSSLTDFRNRDPRLSQSFWISGDIYPQNSGLTRFMPGTIYKIKKMFVVSEWQQQASFYDFNIMRYAEILLNYAEAKFELNGSLNDADIELTINALRKRATGNDILKLPLLSNGFVASNGLDMRTEIRRERTVELAFEGFRYWDLLRWKTAETILPKAILGRRYFPGESGSSTIPSNVDANNFLILENASTRSFDPNKNYLWPLPIDQINLSNNTLDQNPNWSN